MVRQPIIIILNINQDKPKGPEDGPVAGPVTGPVAGPWNGPEDVHEPSLTSRINFISVGGAAK